MTVPVPLPSVLPSVEEPSMEPSMEPSTVQTLRELLMLQSESQPVQLPPTQTGVQLPFRLVPLPALKCRKHRPSNRCRSYKTHS